ncbi:hypothetical protein TQ29_15055 [Actibacterium sp. EMB200-NS6]|nr:hypothetical protein TQ29_15055 [Actibacterium sp. EMB200-NS6]
MRSAGKDKPPGLRSGVIKGRCRPGSLSKRASETAFALRLLACELTGASNRLGLLARFLLGRFLEMLLELHFAKHTLALQFLLQGTKRLIDIVVANTDLHVVFTTFLVWSFINSQEGAV